MMFFKSIKKQKKKIKKAYPNRLQKFKYLVLYLALCSVIVYVDGSEDETVSDSLDQLTIQKTESDNGEYHKTKELKDENYKLRRHKKKLQDTKRSLTKKNEDLEKKSSLLFKIQMLLFLIIFAMIIYHQCFLTNPTTPPNETEAIKNKVIKKAHNKMKSTDGVIYVAEDPILFEESSSSQNIDTSRKSSSISPQHATFIKSSPRQSSYYNALKQHFRKTSNDSS